MSSKTQGSMVAQ